MNKIFGIDISKYQDGIDLSLAKKEGVNFVIIRGGYTGSSSKQNIKDECFEKFYTLAKQNKLGTGVYYFSRATSYNEGKKEADFLYDQCLKNKQFDYPIYIDVEDDVYQSKVGKTKVTKAIQGFCETLEKKGYYVGIYANLNWFNNYIETKKLQRYDKWIAYWGDHHPSNPINGMWQFGGETNLIRSNKIANIVCDQDYAYINYPMIIKENKLNGYNENSIVPNNEDKNYTSYIVKKGDTLSDIASKFHTTYQKIAKDNNIPNPNLIYPGQKLLIYTNPTGNPGYTTYKVKKGDTLSDIASKFHTTYQKIAKDNNISNPNLIYPGQIIVIKK